MNEPARRAIAIVGVGAVLPDAPSAAAFWENLRSARYSIGETPKERWDPDLYYDPDPKATDKSYSKIGGWVKQWEWNPLAWRLPIPPAVSQQMDRGQQWSIVAAREALADYGWPARALDPERTAVILGNAMGGDKHYLTALRIFFPEYAQELEHAPSFGALPHELRQEILAELRAGVGRRIPEITEDTMPGELANIMAGRVANVFNFHGPNYVVDAACASAMAALDAALQGLEQGDYDAVLTGGVDANMSASSYVKFCKIGALSATGTRPYADGADGFVMGEGAALFLLKRLADAERDGDQVYAVIRGLAGSSDGKGKGITAPNPVGQKLALERAWQNAGLDPGSASLIEGHGTSTKVGDVIEADGIAGVFGAAGARPGSIPLGSVKSNIGHLKAAAGAAGILKTALALHHRELPPSLHFERPNPSIDFGRAPFYVNTERKPWDVPSGAPRRAGVSAFGFGGTNFHTVLEEHVPGRLKTGERVLVGYAGTGFGIQDSGFRGTSTATSPPAAVDVSLNPESRILNADPDSRQPTADSPKAPLRGALVLGGATGAELRERLQAALAEAQAGRAPAPAPPAAAELRAPLRLALDYGDAAELAGKAAKALKALDADNPGMWKALRAQGVFLGRGAPGKVAFLYTGQGSQYANMLKALREHEPIVADTFAEADAVMTPILGRPLSRYVFVDHDDDEALRQLEEDLKQTEITQPAVLATDIALTRLLAAYGIEPEMVMGHSLGEYGALVAAGALPFADALRAVSARGHAMKEVSVADNGLMAAVFAPLAEVERILREVDGDVVPANLNSRSQAVIGGGTESVRRAMAAFRAAGYQVAQLPVSHAFHTHIVAPASEPLRRELQTLELRPPRLPIVANVSGGWYPMHPGARAEMIEILACQVAAPVQFVTGLQTLYDAGARVFVETGPKKALHGFVEEVLGEQDDVVALFTNHPKTGDLASFNQALCGLYATGVGFGGEELSAVGCRLSANSNPAPQPVASDQPVGAHPARSGEGPQLTDSRQPTADSPFPNPQSAIPMDRYLELGRLFADFLERGRQLYEGRDGGEPARALEPVVVTGAALGLPGSERVFDDRGVARLLRGEQLIDVIPTRVRAAMVDKHITRLVKGETGEPHFEVIASAAEVIKLAGRAGKLDLVAEFGFPAERLDALDATTRLAIGAGLDALRDAGIPLAMRYKTTTRGTRLPERWMLPDALRDETGVIFASAFPGYDAFADEMQRYHADRALRQRLADLQGLRARADGADPALAAELDRRIHELQAELERAAYVLDRKLLFRLLSMGHSQFAEYVGARGPNTQINAACASTTQAVGLAEDWIRAGRCRRVVVVSADDVTSDRLLEWVGAGFLASGAAATDELVEDAAIPFDRRRHGMIVGMGAAALVVESAAAARERGVRPIAEVLGTVTANSAFHGTRLDVEHIAGVMEAMVAQAERQWGVTRAELAPQTVFVSHETYTPARGGSAQAEVEALRRVFGPAADRVVIANTKGYTGHAMGAGIEDVLALKALETGIVPPVANFREVDPELGSLNLSRGGLYPVRYALRLGAGFGSQIALSLVRWVPSPDGSRPTPDRLGYAGRLADRAAWSGWLQRVSGYAAPEVEVVQRTLRLKDQGAPQLEPAREVTAALTPRPPLPPAGEGVAPTQATARPAPAVPALKIAPTPAAPPQPAADRRPPTADRRDSVTARVLELVAQQTGYPPEMLDLELDLEADLGIDTVKQAEMFAAVRGAWDIPRDENLKLRDFPTLKHVVQFVLDRRPELRESGFGIRDSGFGGTATPAARQEPEGGSGGEGQPDPVVAKVLALVAAQTGYPQDLLDLDLDLEADLGIDTVKQAEMFANVRQAWDIPRDENLKLRDYPTLQHVIQFVRDRAPALQPAPPTEEGEARSAGDEGAVRRQPAAGSQQPTADVPRRVPVAVLRPALELCKPTGVALDETSRVVVMLDAGGVGQALLARLEKRGVTVLALDGAPDAEALVARLEQFAAEGPVTGVYWLPALDEEGDPFRLEPEQWREALRVRAKLLYATLRALYAPLGEPGAFLVSATRLGGQHGYDEAGAVAPLGGAVVGLTKTFKRERPAALVKAVDFAPGRKTAALAERLLEETLRDPGAVEVGYRDELRYAVGLEVQPRAEDGARMTLGRETVFVVTGAAGSIVSAITADLAAASGGVFYLLDLVPEPERANPDIARFADDREGLKRELFERLKATGERATPARVEKELTKLERAHAALGAIQAIEQAGGSAHYRSVDLRDGAGVARVIDEVRARHGRIDVLLHAAGLEISRFLPDKQPPEFDLVFDVKADGWYHLLHAIGEMPLGATVAFSSVAGRFGNAGQADYSAANDLLCKTTSGLRRTHPATHGLAVDWTAWGGIGMATRGSIPKMMEAAGIDLLPPEVGVPFIRRELSAGGWKGEVVVGQRLGVLTQEWDESGGLDVAALAVLPHGPVGAEVKGFALYDGLTVETTLDPGAQPFLDDHRIEGTPVLPGVMGLEAFAEAAVRVFPGWQVAAVEEVQFLAPFKCYRDEPRTLTVRASFRREGDELLADCRLEGRRELPKGPELTTHFTGTVRLARPAPAPERVALPQASGRPPVEHDEVYRVYFHGPAYRVLQRAWRAGEAMLGELKATLPPNHAPAELPLVVAPRLVELCFQTAGVLEIGATGRMGLPRQVRRLRILRAGAEAGERTLVALVQPREDGSFDALVADQAGDVYLRLEGYRTVALPTALPADALRPFAAAVRPAVEVPA